MTQPTAGAEREPFSYPDHDSRTIHVQDGWRLECSCGKLGDVRDTVDAANTDRFEHEAEVDR